jgi:survival of motor neuron-related-splicing factor 30
MEAGSLVEGLYSGSWYPGVVVGLEGDDTIVEFLGYKNVEVCNKSSVRAISLTPTLDASQVEVGMILEGFFPGDSSWYPTVTVETKTEHGFIVNFSGASREELPINYLRSKAETRVDNDLMTHQTCVKSEEEGATATSDVIPFEDNEQMLKKKKKLKSLKKKESDKIAEEDHNGKQANWQTFVKKASGKRVKGAVATKAISNSSMFTTTTEGKVGVTGSGQGTTNYEQRKRYKFK